MTKRGIMASRSKGIPKKKKKIERSHVLILDSLCTFFFLIIVPNPTSLFSLFSMEIILSEICLLKLMGIPHWDELWGTIKDENMTFNCAGKKSLFNRHIFFLVCCPLIVHESYDIILWRTLPAVRRTWHVLERWPPSQQFGKRYNILVVTHSQADTL